MHQHCRYTRSALALGMIVVTVLGSPTATRAAAPEGTAVRNRDAEPAAPAQEATLTLWNRRIVTFRTTIAGHTPEARAQGAARRLAELPVRVMARGVTATNFSWESYQGKVVAVGGVPVFRLVEDDLDPDSDETLDVAADRAAARLREAVQAYVDQRRVSRVLRGVVLAVLSTVLFIVVLRLIRRSRNRLTERLVAAAAAPVQRVSAFGLDLRQHAILVANWLVRVLAWAAGLASAYAWLTFVLVQFPYSVPWGQSLGAYIWALIKMFGTAVVGAIPGFATVVAIFLVTRWVTATLGNFFQAVEAGQVEVAWLAPEMARATRRIAAFLIWAFALTVAYPFIPGSDSAAFKGVSVLLGIMLSLGSAGLVNQVMSGFVVVYSRAFRPGDYVHIGDVQGTVTEIGMLSTKVRGATREEVTIPNAVVVSTTAVNFSRPASAPESSLAQIAVTVGYDTPWRQVHALLLTAAERTAGLRREPAPYVLQRALSDFYVEYQLVVWVESTTGRAAVLSDLRASIQDCFNEHGVQLMSPHFESQPDAPVVVPPSKWFTAPAAERAHGSAPDRSPQR